MNVVVVDDSKVNTVFLSALLSKLEGVQSFCFTSAAEALSWCRAMEPDLVLVDYMMPEMDGLEFVRRFRESRGCAEIPVLMVTSVNEAEVRYQALEYGANDFLTKPVDKSEFVPRVRNMLALRRHQRMLADRAEGLASEVRMSLAGILAREHDTILRLSRAAEFRDPETGSHIQRMASYSQLIAKAIGFSESDQELILRAAPMHDVGKVGTPDHILLKPGKLDPEEFEIMKQHAAIGYEILRGSSSHLLQAAALIAVSHHEKFDGSGYPHGRAGEAIPLFGRIVAVADVFDALTSERPYKRAWEVERAAAVIREGAGSHFDPACVEAFFQQWDEVLAIHEAYPDVPRTSEKSASEVA
ncbi:MAG TPA: HD domain-containing phosphohydrolase [Pantanalinema sp.]